MQSIRLDTYASKRISEEVEKALDVSLNQIDVYWSDGVITLLLVKKKDSVGGGVIESLASELKNYVRISFFYFIVNCCMYAQSKALQKSVEQLYGAGGLGGGLFREIIALVLVDTGGTW